MRAGPVSPIALTSSMANNDPRQICSYEGSAYRTEFWGEGRHYEDAVERVALRHLLPSTGPRLIDIGGGYGRLVPLYDGYDEVVIFDYALSQLRQAQQLWGTEGPDGHPRYIYVAGDFYNLPFATAAFATVVMVRTLHHAADAPAVIHGVSQILAPGGQFILEFANKRNLKAILRYLFGRQHWSPFDRAPVEFVPLNFDFHPAWIEELLTQEGLHTQQRRAVSMFRLGLLKMLVPTHLLVALDRICQPLGNLLPVSPSVFLHCEASDMSASRSSSSAALFCCPRCAHSLERRPERLVCRGCGASFPVQNGIYNFKAASSPVPSTSAHDPLSHATPPPVHHDES